MTQLEAQLEGLAIGLEQRGEKSAAQCCRHSLAEIARMRAAIPSRVEIEEIENMRKDYESGRKIFASSAAVALRVIDSFIKLTRATNSADEA